MTTTTYHPSGPGPGLVAEAAQATRELLARLRQALAERRRYRRTVAELRPLSMRQREDIGIAGLDPEALARAAARLD